MTSGSVAAMSSKAMPSASEYCAGAFSVPMAAPSSSSFASFQGVDWFSLPP
ncbi:hypothetical protein QFZ50_002695 [Arthrobacter agilis]|nr:hypothetical protein [Arthrobacter agilis]